MKNEPFLQKCERAKCFFYTCERGKTIKISDSNENHMWVMFEWKISATLDIFPHHLTQSYSDAFIYSLAVAKLHRKKKTRHMYMRAIGERTL